MTKEPGTFRLLNRTLPTKGSDKRSNYLAMDGRVSVADLLAYMALNHPSVHPSEMMLNFGTLTWVDDATPEELEQMRRWEEERGRKTEEWERATLQRLTEKYGPP
jgi:hypothetical protein